MNSGVYKVIYNKLKLFFILILNRIPSRVVEFFFNLYMIFIENKAFICLSEFQNNTFKIKNNDIILFCCLRNELRRMHYFFEYYKKIGVDHFVIIDNGSSDDIKKMCAKRQDVTLFYTEASFKKARFGMLWINRLLRQYGSNHWCLIVDPDEFLVYPNIETHNLRALGKLLDHYQSPCLHVVMIDMYSDKSIGETSLNIEDNPFNVCPYFDRDGYIQTEGWAGSAWTRGGPRMRSYFAHNAHQSPALNKIPFIKWKYSYHYRSAAHDVYPVHLNGIGYKKRNVPTGALLHFKMVSNLSEKSHEEMYRAQHYSDSLEYKQYNNAYAPEFFEDGISVRYEGVSQLIDLGLMRSGLWF